MSPGGLWRVYKVCYCALTGLLRVKYRWALIRQSIKMDSRWRSHMTKIVSYYSQGGWFLCPLATFEKLWTFVPFFTNNLQKLFNSLRLLDGNFNVVVDMGSCPQLSVWLQMTHRKTFKGDNSDVVTWGSGKLLSLIVFYLKKKCIFFSSACRSENTSSQRLIRQLALAN